MTTTTYREAETMEARGVMYHDSEGCIGYEGVDQVKCSYH
jgi:hypothetical protein